jgi:hypothetical protein
VPVNGAKSIGSFARKPEAPVHEGCQRDRGPARFIAQPASRDRVPRLLALFEDQILDPLPGLEKPAVFDLAVELTDRLVRSVRLLPPPASDRTCSPPTNGAKWGWPDIHGSEIDS